MSNIGEKWLVILFSIVLCSCESSLEVPNKPAYRGDPITAFIDKIESEKKLLEDDSIEQHVRGLVVFIKILSRPNELVTGSAIQAALDKYSPDFKHEQKDIYDGLVKIENFFNRDGIVYFESDQKKDIKIDKMKIKSGARFTLENSISDKTIRIKVIDGINVGVSFIRFDLDTIEIDVESGDIRLLYGFDQNAKVNIAKDILDS